MMIDPPLYRAALAGDVPMLLSILHEDPSALHRVQTTSIGDTIVHIAALLGHSEFIREILSHNPLLAREVNRQGCSPLHLASEKGQVQVMEELLHVAGTELFLIMDKGGRLPVHVAALAGKTNVLQKLMETDPDCLEKLTSGGETALHCGVKANQMQVVRFLANTTKYIEQLNMKDDKRSTVLHLAAARRSKEMIRFLLRSSGIEVNATNQKGETPLDVILSRLPQEGVAADEVSEIIREAGGLSRDETGHAVLNMPPPAATEETDAKWLKDMRKSLMVVAALIATIAFKAGISGRKRDDSQDSKATPPISVGNNIAYYGTSDHPTPCSPKYIEQLKMKDDKGSTILHLAAVKRSKEMTRFLLGSSGIEVNATNQQGETPLGVILSRLPQGGVAADEVSEIIPEAGGLPKDEIGHAVLNMPPPGIEGSATNQQGEAPPDVILSRPPQGGVAADEVNEIIREAGGLSKDETGHAVLNMPPPAATEESYAKWLKDMRKSLMVVAALIATIAFEAGISGRKRDDRQDSKATSPISMVNDIAYYGTFDHAINLLEERQYVAFLVFDVTSLFASLTVILLLLTRFPVKKQRLVVFLSGIMHLAIFTIGSAFLLLVAVNKDNHAAVPIIAIFWIVWFNLTCYSLVTLFEMAARCLWRLGLERLLVAPKNPCPLGLIVWPRLIMTSACFIVLSYVLCIRVVAR